MSKGKRRALELGKDALIVLLVLSALWLACRPQLYGRQMGEWLNQMFHHTAAIAPDPEPDGGDAWMTQPVRMAAMTAQGRYGTPYDSQGTQTLFSVSAGLLNEALSTAAAPRAMGMDEWESALSSAPGLYFEFAAALPLNTLAGLLSNGESDCALTHTACRMVLTVLGGQVCLVYWNEEDGTCWRSDTDVVSEGQLDSAVSAAVPNGVLFAFERADCQNLAGYTMLPAQTPAPLSYLASNPLSEEARSTLLERLGFRVQGTSSYEAPDGTVYLNGGDSLRVSGAGQVRYSAGGEQARFPVDSEGTDGLRQCIQASGQLVRQTMGLWQGQAELQLTGCLRQEDGSVLLEYDYFLNGALVTRYDGTSAAAVLVREGQITEFVMNLRSYAAGTSAGAVLPVAQAAAAVTALEGAGGELLLCYQDTGTEGVSAGWIVTR